MYLQRSKMNHTVNIWMRLKHLIKALLICNVALVVLGLLPANQLDAIEGLAGGVVEVVNDDYFVVGFEECEGGEGADVASATAHRNISIESWSFIGCLGSVQRRKS